MLYKALNLYNLVSEIMNIFRSHNCGELNSSNEGLKVRLSGWVNRVRDHGGVLFIDLRDHYGLTQVLVDPDSKVFKKVEKVRSEWCIRIDGTVKKRSVDLINSKLSTGEIEVYIENIDFLSKSDELPIPVFGDLEYPEEKRLRYRYLDLRREKLHNNIVLRSKVIKFIREKMWESGFNEFQTPILTASSPEGARDFLVPSRLHPGKFYALPQAPQQFKQLIMVSGFDKYFQIAPCFRDEDPRADRSPTDFYQLDIEMSFVKQEDIFNIVEPIITKIFKKFSNGKKVDENWTQITYKDSISWFGTDKPDLRNPIKMSDVSDFFSGSNFKIFSELLEKEGNKIWAIPAPGGGSRRFCDKMNSFAQKEGLPGMGYIFWREGESGLEAAGPLAKNIGEERTNGIKNKLSLKEGDSVFFLAGIPKNFINFASKVRNVIAESLSLIDKNRFAFAWIKDFPMFEKNEENGEYDFSHNPFSMPQGGLKTLDQDPSQVLGYQYDLTCNGYELLSGAIRNHELETLFKAFQIAGYDISEVEKKFNGIVESFRYGAPPHGGCAAGIDRMIMLLAGEENIREVIMFPMNQKAEDSMMGAPSDVSFEQLSDLSLNILDE